ncbi:MAG: hypothetical protein CVU56_03910 [Deltaproteobacteria bacterium HGW-Deltaproteobacteria-14]|nr:MAG: hypothetical protein CVU56_03910 [Deltaproteobacteria bacterium HGW-Deltaproteobacteria-14]
MQLFGPNRRRIGTSRGGRGNPAGGAALSALLGLALALLPVAPAHAAPSTFAIERFEPLPSPGLNILNVSTSRVLTNLRASIGLQLHYAQSSLTLIRTDAAGELVDTLVDDRVVTDFVASMGLFGHLEIGVALPVILGQSGGDLDLFGRPDDTAAGGGVGDLRVIAKARFWYPEDAGGFGLHLLLPVALPTGDGERFASDGAITLQPTLGLDYRHANGLTIALNVGWLYRPRRTYATVVRGQEIRWAVGVEVPTSLSPLSAWASFFGAYPLDTDRDALDPTVASDRRSIPMELLGGLRVRVGEDFCVTAGAGAGIAGDVGAPDLRATFGIAYTPTANVRDADDDGLRDPVDACPNDPEDRDGFEDDDGCPDLDDDGDGIPDDVDECPRQAEDLDGFQDGDGCPDLDNDGDGIPDAIDQCPDVAEDRDGFQDEDGCPDLDNDGDGIPDVRDSCPFEAEDFDGYQDGDGCVDPDNDKDGILDNNDQCPDFPETFNGFDDEDGCPDTRSRYVKVFIDEIRLLRPIYFSKREAIIKPVSFPVLDDVADVVLSNAQITKLRIEGHTDDMGNPKRNEQLSVARARAVRDYLVARGVDESVLEIQGYGATRPIAFEDTEVGRAQNRRVEFKIVEISGRPITSPGRGGGE